MTCYAGTRVALLMLTLGISLVVGGLFCVVVVSRHFVEEAGRLAVLPSPRELERESFGGAGLWCREHWNTLYSA